MARPKADPTTQRRRRILEGSRGREFDEAMADPALRKDMEIEAETGPEPKLVTKDMLELAGQARRAESEQKARFGAFFGTTADAIIVPGFLGSELRDATPNGRGVVWIDPELLLDRTDDLRALKLGEYERNRPETDADATVRIEPNGAIPVVYGVLKLALRASGYRTTIFGVDWRKNLEESAERLARELRGRESQPARPLHLVAHSQGSLVARRALQLIGSDTARRVVQRLVLLGPATAGSFSAVTALAGNHSLLKMVKDWGIDVPADFPDAIRSMSGVYQLIPWREEPLGGPGGRTDARAVDDAIARADPTSGVPGGRTDARAVDWVKRHADDFRSDPSRLLGVRVDAKRFKEFFGWGKTIDTGFFNDRTTIILGDTRTVVGVRGGDGTIEDSDFSDHGDGTVPDALALIEGVTNVYKAPNAEHMKLPMTWEVVVAVRDVLAGRRPGVAPYRPIDAEPAPFPQLAKRPLFEPAPAPSGPPAPKDGEPAPTPPRPLPTGRRVPEAPAPANRRLRVYSYDPLTSADLDMLGVDHLCVSLPWEFTDGLRLQPGPVGEYLEVVDLDPASGCVYAPVDLNHPHLLAQDGLQPSEGDPRFHQQMVFAVAMGTIRHFETALGRRVLWSPRLERDGKGRVVSNSGFPPEVQLNNEFVRRLRIHPHALRQANAYYHPEKKALLFGYFPAAGSPGGKVAPGGTVFTCLSHDIVAHETTHALLDGVHRYFAEPSNPDVFAFHEAFADVVALFQHFSHPEVLLRQLALTRGDLKGEGSLGTLAAQFGEALGHRGALRQYLGEKDKRGRWVPVAPDPTAMARVHEPHERGAILVAALFRAFADIYENRVKDLRRIATGGTGVLPEGDLHPDLVARMADEAAKAARHMLSMCLRAIDYVPPVDITFGEYLRALITADYDLIRDDDRRYRVSVISAFRDWGIYPPDVHSLSVEGLLWRGPELGELRNLASFLNTIDVAQWDLHCDRRRSFALMQSNSRAFHRWLSSGVELTDRQMKALGLALGPKAPGTIRRAKESGRPVFEVHSFRPCRRIGPDGQQLTEYVVEIVQRRAGFFDPEVQKKYDDGRLLLTDDVTEDFVFRGGCSILIDPTEAKIRYCVRKPVDSAARLERERRHRLSQFGDKFGGAYFGGGHDASPFAFLHSCL